MNLIEFYNNHKNDDISKLTKEEQFIMNCFKFDIFKANPSKKHIKNFEYLYEVDYPINFSDLSKHTISELNKCINIRKKDEKDRLKWEKQRAKNGFSDVDVWSIDTWFLNILPKMLKQLRDCSHGYPAPLELPENFEQFKPEVPSDQDADMVYWEAILDRMIYLLQEANEDTCSFINIYEKDYMDMMDSFRVKYGYGGQKLKTVKELEDEKASHTCRMYFPKDFPNLYPDAEELTKNYLDQEQSIFEYRDACKEEFFKLFSKYFWNLWD